MDEKIKNLWNNNKLLFFLLLPIILIFVFRDLVISILIGSARKTAEEAKREDANLQSQANQADRDADKLKGQVDNLEDDIKKRNENDIGEDWNKK